MFITLFLKECKLMLKCLTYYLILIGIVLFCTTQLGEFEMIQKPKPGMADYGETYSTDKTVIMNETVKKLASKFILNKYVTYPVGFYKEVILNKKKQSNISDILVEVTGRDKETFTTGSDDLSVTQNITYEHFAELMAKADKLLGGGSYYAKDKLKINARVPMTYEQAMEEYNNTVKKDHLSGAYARYFCDYMGIILAVLPIFIAVTRGLRDKRAKANEIIYSRNASSLQIIMSRYLAMVVMLLFPIILLSSFMSLECIYYGAKAGITVDYFAFLKYTCGWLLPTIMITISVGAFLTELTDTAIAIIVQGLWWIISVFVGTVTLVGNYGWNLIPRHNKLGYYQIFHDDFGELAANRITYALLALVLAFGTVIIYEMKRKGRLNIHGKIFANRKNKSEI